MRAYIVFSVMIISGLCAMLIQVNIDEDSFGHVLVRQISSVLLIGGTLSLLYKMFVDQENREFLHKALKIHKSINEIGLSRVIPETKGERTNAYIDIITNSTELYILMNDGAHWIENYSSYLEKRFSEKSTTEFYLVDRNGEFINSLSNKVNASVDSQKRRIEDAIQSLKKIYERSEKLGNLQIYNLVNYPTYTLLVSEERAFIIPYFTSEGFNKIPPLFEFEKKHDGSFVNKLIQEFEDLRKSSTLEYSSK